MTAFEHLNFIYFALLALLPIWVVYRYMKWYKLQSAKLGSISNVQKLLKGAQNKGLQQQLYLIVAVVLLSTIALMNLRMGSGTEKTTRKGLDIVIALDVSKSMLAQDVSPNRLDRAKTFIQQTLRKVSDDRVGLVVFAGKSYLQSPITSDFNAVNMLLESVSPDMIPTQGTVLGEAIEMSRKAFNSEFNKYKVILLVTDGEDHDEHAISMAEKAAKEGVVIYTIGVGSTEGAQIIDPQTMQVKTDESGNIVVSKLNEEILKKIATAAEGKYFNLYNAPKVAEDVVSNINSLEKRNQGTVVFAEYQSYYQWFLLAAIIFLILESCFTLFCSSKNKLVK